jgi:hypothetical protein
VNQCDSLVICTGVISYEMVQLSLCKVQLHSRLISALDGCEWSASHFDRFDPINNIVVTSCVRGCVDLGVSVGVSESEKCLLPAGKRNFNFRVVQAVALSQYRLSHSGS